MQNPQAYAVDIELIMRDYFNCDRFGVGGLVDSDYIRQNYFLAMMSTITYLYGRKETNDINVVANFFKKFSYYGDWSIDQLLSFESSTQTINGLQYGIKYESGEKAMKAIIDEFSAVCQKLK